MSFAVQQSINTASRCVQLRKSACKAKPLVARSAKKAVISRTRVSVTASAKTDEILESMKTLTLLEASELVSAMEETFGISTAAMAAPAAAAPGAAGGAPAEAAEEQTEFDLVLEGVEDSSNRIKVIKVVRALTGLGLKEAKGMVEGAPKALKEGASKADCEEGLKQLEEAGAKASIK